MMMSLEGDLVAVANRFKFMLVKEPLSAAPGPASASVCGSIAAGAPHALSIVLGLLRASKRMWSRYCRLVCGGQTARVQSCLPATRNALCPHSFYCSLTLARSRRGVVSLLLRTPQTLLGARVPPLNGLKLMRALEPQLASRALRAVYSPCLPPKATATLWAREKDILGLADALD